MIASARTSRHRHSRRGLRLHEWANGFRPVAIFMIVLLLNSEFAFGSWLSAITGVDVNVPAGTISFSSPRPDAIPEMLKNFPVDVLEFAYNCLLTKGVCPGVWMATLVRQAKAQALAGSQPIPSDIRGILATFFPAYILDKARWTLADPNRSELERMIFGGGCPDVQILGLYVSCSNGALTLDNVIVFVDQMNEAKYERWAHELTHVSQYDGMGVDGFAFAYTLDPKALEDQAYGWEHTVKSAVENHQVSQPYWTMAPGGRVSLTTNNFTGAIARVSSDPAWRQSHTGFGHGGDCDNFRVGGTDTGPYPDIPTSDAHLNRGRNYEAAQNWPSAITEYREAVRFNFANAVALDRLGVALTKGGQPQEGILQIKKAICLDKSGPRFRGDLAAAQLSNGDVNAAIIEYQIAIYVNQRNPQYHRELATALEKRGDAEGAKTQYWAANLLKPGDSSGRKPPPSRPIAASPPLPVPAWLERVTWGADTADKWYATVGGRGCRIDLTRQVRFEPRPDKPLLVYTEDTTLLSDNASNFCIDHSDDPAVKKHIKMSFRFTLAPKPDGTITVNGALDDPCSQCVLPKPLATSKISGVIDRRTDREFWLTLRGAVHGGFQMRPTK